MSERNTARGLHVVGVGLIVLERLVQQSGYAVSSQLDALAAALWMSVIGYSLFFVFVRCQGSLGVKRFDRPMWWSVSRIAASNSVIAVAYVVAVAKLGLGVTAAITALGPLSVGFLTAGQLSLRLRLMAFAGVVMVNQPWKWQDEFNNDTFIGLFAAFMSAIAFWNYLTAVFKKMDKGKTKEGLAVAGLITVPGTLLLVWLTQFMGNGRELTAFAPSGDVVLTGAIAGVLVVAFPAAVQQRAARMVSEQVTSILYLLSSPFAATIGAVGVALGWLPHAQAPNFWVWCGITIVILAALGVTLMGARPSSAKPGA